jgi:glycosyltransferase involved in cell wall biosynthesis
MDARVVRTVCLLREQNRFMKGLFAWVGFRQTSVSFHRPERASGKTSWSLWKLWNFALDGITSFSTLPLRIWTYLGIGFAVLSFVYATFLVVRTLLFGIGVPGYASIMVVVLTLGAVQFLSLGIIGEYVGRIYLEVKRRPLYIVDEDEAGRSSPSSDSRSSRE